MKASLAGVLKNYQGTASRTAAGVQLVEGIHLEPDTADTSDLFKTINMFSVIKTT